MNKLIMAGIAAIMLSQAAKADDIFKGMKGPTDWQLDSRVSYSSTGQTRTATQTEILKYWDSKKFCFASIPYRHIEAQVVKEGVGDVAVGCGPRGTIGQLHFISYAGTVFPSHSAVSNERRDIRTGIFSTYLTKSRKLEFDLSAEYFLTGESHGKNAPDEFHAGFVTGGQLFPKIRLAGGITTTVRDHGYRAGAKLVGRYTFSPRFHMQLAGTKDFATEEIPASKGLELIGRYNF
jgi:hypothetical protein